MAAEISAPLAKVKKVTMVSSGGKDVGASKITGELLDIVIRMPQAMEQLTGVDITKVKPCMIYLTNTWGQRIGRDMLSSCL